MGAMRTIVLALLLVFASAAARADQTDQRLERLFKELAAVRTLPEATLLESQITAMWLTSGSDTVDVLMTRALEAMRGEDVATAKRLLDVVVEMKPDYAAVWYLRAELLVAMDSQQEAAADLKKALELEPRHFRALVLAGRLAEGAGDKKAAAAAYRRAAELNPMLEAIARRAEQLETDLARRPPPI